MGKFSLSTFQRLPIYLNYLDSIDWKNQTNISATQLAMALNLGEIQVRKDLASLSCEGKPKIGYDIKVLIKALKKTLGCHTKKDAVIVGVGKLGQALMGYSGFAEFGLNIVAGFDVDVSKTDSIISGAKILPIENLRAFLTENDIPLIILTLPQTKAQEIVNMVEGTCVKGIWNFTTAHINAPKGVIVKTENMASSLAILSKQISEI